MRLRWLGALAAVPLLSGCFTVDVAAPYGTDITLVSSASPTTVRREYRTWFVAWGLTHLDNTMPDLVLDRERITEARIIVEDNVPDALHGILYNILIPIGLVTQTVIIEGNRTPPADPPKKAGP